MIMFHYIIIGLILGWGAAIPIGPINIEMVRRNLSQGISAGLNLGFGACCADMSYLALISYGISTLLTHELLLHIVSFFGAIVLGWFGIQACRVKTTAKTTDTISNQQPRGSKATRSNTKDFIQGYLLTLLNPYTILFWASISSQVALYRHYTAHALLWVGAGVLLGALSWSISLNIIIHLIRHKISAKAMRRLNLIGGIILLGFSILGLMHSGVLHVT